MAPGPGYPQTQAQPIPGYGQYPQGQLMDGSYPQYPQGKQEVSVVAFAPQVCHGIFMHLHYIIKFIHDSSLHYINFYKRALYTC